MSSLNDDPELDPTLPVDFDGSTNPDLLSEVTFGANLTCPDGSVPMVAKAGSGRMSPIRARTMKEYDQQIGDLKKENFSLKLRIYFLEERMQQKFGGDDLFKTNIELKVEVETLKKDLLEKQDLLKKASNALESVDIQHQVELKKARAEASTDALGDMRGEFEAAQVRVDDLQRQLQVKDEELVVLHRQLEGSNQQLRELVMVQRETDAAYRVLENDKRQLENRLEDTDSVSVGTGGMGTELAEKETLISQLRSVLKTKELIIEQQEEESKQEVKELQVQLQQLQCQLDDKDAETEDLKDKNEDSSASDSEMAGLGTTDTHSLLQAELEDQRLRLSALEADCGQLATEVQNKDAMIGKLEDVIRERVIERDAAQRRLSELERLNHTHQDNALKRDKAIQGLAGEITRKIKEIEIMSEKLGQRDEELGQVKDTLHMVQMDSSHELGKHQEELSAQQAAIAELEASLQEEQLQKQRIQKTIGDKESEVLDLTHRLEEADEKLRLREDSLQDLEGQLHAEKQNDSVQDAGKLPAEDNSNEMRPSKEDESSVNEEGVHRLTSGQQDNTGQPPGSGSTGTDQQGPSDTRQKLLEEEIDALKVALSEREADIQRANQMLLTTEKTLESMENEVKEKETTLTQLTSALMAQQKTMEETADVQRKVLEEKENQVQKLRTSLSKKDQNLQEQQESLSRQVAALNKELQQAQTALSEKQLQLQSGESQASQSEQQQQEMLDKLRAALSEKEKTIQALLASSRQKDQLFRQLRGTSPDSGDTKRMAAEIQRLKDEVSNLQNQVHGKDDVIEQLQKTSRKHNGPQSRVPLRQLQNTEDELALRTESELRAEVETLRGQLDDQQGSRMTLHGSYSTVAGGGDSTLQQVIEDEVAESHSLTEALKAERMVYLNLNQAANLMPSDQAEAFQIELQAVQSLRGQLQDGVEHNRHMRAALESQVHDTSGTCGNSESAVAGASDLEKEVSALRRELKESKRLNASLQERLNHALTPQQRDGAVGGASNGVGGASNGVGGHKSVTNIALTNGAVGGFNTVDGATGPDHHTDAHHPSLSFLSMESNSRPGSRMTDTDSLGLPVNSYLPSFRELPQVDDFVPDDLTLSQMSPNELTSVISGLKVELQKAQQQNEELHFRLEGAGRDIPGENRHDPDVNKIPAEVVDERVQSLQAELDSVSQQKQEAERQLELLINGPTSGRDARTVPVLKQQLQKAKTALAEKEREVVDLRSAMGAEVNERRPVPPKEASPSILAAEVTKLQARLKNTENINGLLKKQIELNTRSDDAPMGFNPELIVQMSGEIQKLKREREMAGHRVKDPPTVPSETSSMSSSSSSRGARSGIPTLRRPKSAPVRAPPGVETVQALQQELEHMMACLNEEKVKVKYLEGKLSSTESTVRQQTEKMKHYRGALEDAGLLPNRPLRSRSESNLASLSLSDRSGSPRPRTRTSSSDNLSLFEAPRERERVVSPVMPPTPSVFSDFGKTSNALELKNQIGQLKDYVHNYNDVLQNLKGKLRRISSVDGLNMSPGKNHGPSGANLVVRQEGPLSPTNDYISISSTKKSADQDATNQATRRQEVMELRRRLAEAEVSNVALGFRLRQLEAGGGADVDKLQRVLKAQRKSNELLRRQLSESRSACTALRQRLLHLSELTGEMLHQNAEGEVDVIDITPDRVTGLKNSLHDCVVLAEALNSSLHAPDEGYGVDSDPEQANVALGEDAQQQQQLQQQQQQQRQQLQQQQQQQEQSSGLQDEIQELQEVKDFLQQELQMLQEQKEELQEQLKELQMLQDQKQELQQQVKEFQMLQDQKEELQQQVNDLQLQKQTENAAGDPNINSQLQESLQLLQEENQQLLRQLEEQSSGHPGNQFDNSQEGTKPKDQEIQELQQQVSQLHTDNQQLHRQVEKNQSLQQQLLQLQTMQQQLQLQSELQDQLQESQLENEQLQQQLEAELEKNRSLQLDKNALQKELKEQSNKCKQLESRLQDIGKQLEQSEQARLQLQGLLKQRESASVTAESLHQQELAELKDRLEFRMRLMQLEKEQLQKLVQQLSSTGHQVIDAVAPPNGHMHINGDGQGQVLRPGQGLEQGAPQRELFTSQSVPGVAGHPTQTYPSQSDGGVQARPTKDNRGRHGHHGETGRHHSGSGNERSDFTDSVPQFPEATERARHTTADSTTDQAPLRPLGDSPESVVTDPLGQSTQSVPNKLTLLDSEPGDDVAIDFDKYITKSPSDTIRSQSDLPLAHTNGGDIFNADLGLAWEAFSGSGSGSARSRSHTGGSVGADIDLVTPELVSATSKDELIQTLQTQLRSAEERNGLLKKELKLYENIGASIGVQNSPDMDSHSSQTAGEGEGGDGTAVLLGYLEEMRHLREKLEDSIQKNNHLRQMLEAHLANSKQEVRRQVEVQLSHSHTELTRLREEILIYQEKLQKTDNEKKTFACEVERLRAMERDNRALAREVERLRGMEQDKKSLEREVERLHATEREKQSLEREVERLRATERKNQSLEQEVGQLRATARKNQSLQHEVDRLHGIEKDHLELEQQVEQLRNGLQQDPAQDRLRDLEQDRVVLEQEAERLREQVHEHEQLNKTLKLELSMFDNVVPDGEQAEQGADANSQKPNAPHAANLDLSILLQELRLLRKQLERAIENNDALRQKLEEMSTRQVPPGHTSIHVHHRFVSETNSETDVLNISGGSETEHMRYSIHDPERPPAMMQTRVGADLRTLYAIGELDDYELLKKQINESNTMLGGLDLQVKDRLRDYRDNTQSPDYFVLRQLSTSLVNLRHLATEQLRLVALFWLSQLPAADRLGQAQEQGKTSTEILMLKIQLQKVQRKYKNAREQCRLKDQQMKFWEERVSSRLTETYKVLKKSNANLDRKLGLDPEEFVVMALQ